MRSQSSTPDSLQEKRRLEKLRWYYEHREHAQKMARDWKAAHKEQVAAALKKWRAANPDKVKASNASRPKRDLEKERVRLTKWRDENRELARQRVRASQAKNPLRVREATTRRRALLKGNRAEPYSRAEIFERDCGVCQLCSRPVEGTWHIDHIIPLSKGGPDASWNVQVAHPECNQRKNDSLDWARAEQMASEHPEWLPEVRR